MKKVKLAIYGAGKMGLAFYNKLQNAACEVAYFCDNNLQKQAQGVCNIPVLSFEQLCEIKNEVLVIVSPIDAHDIYHQLEEHEFPLVLPPAMVNGIRMMPTSKIQGAFSNFYPLGHYYSLYPDLDTIIEREDVVFNIQKEVWDIDLNLERQCALLAQMQALYPALPAWKSLQDANQDSQYRYRYDNLSLSRADAVHLHCMLQVLKPKRLIEVGSGYTSAITLDTNEYYLDGQMQVSFIEPYPQTLKSLLKPTDHITLTECGLEEVPLDYFEQLESGDVLFIDSTHVSKIGSDVNYLFFEIFPRLKKGVYIHLHDIFYPFEYPKDWIVSGMVWNELYLLRAFLQNNSAYSVQYFQNMVEKKFSENLQGNWPFCEIAHGGSFWMRKE